MPTTEKKYEYALPVGTVIKGKNQQYRIESVLGQGGFGITYRVASTLRVGTIEVEAIFALKEHFIKGHCHRAANGLVVEYGREAAELVEKSRHDFQTEAERLTLVCEGCENIVKVSEVIEQNNTVYYVMEYLDGGDLRSLVKQRGTPLSEAETISIIIPIAKAIGFIHQHNLLHLDIKPDNIVMRRGINGGADVPVLIDFGIAKHFDKKGTPTSQINAKGATLGYSPIEQYDMISHFAPEIDVYALAATTFYLLTATDPDSAFNLKAELISQKLPDNLSDRTRQAVIQGMAKLSENRTPSPQAFIKNLRERYSLPINYVLRGQESKYRIIGVKGESDSHLLYSASIDTGEDIAANSPQQTAIVNYDIYELFDSNNSRRKKDESVTDTSQAAIKQFEAMLKSNFNYDFNSPTHLRDTALAYEYFNANGTIYYVRRHDYRPQSALSQSLSSIGTSLTAATTGSLHAISRHKGKIAVIAAVIAIAYLGISNADTIGSWFKSDKTAETVEPEEDITAVEEEQLVEETDNPNAITQPQQTTTSQAETNTTNADEEAKRKKEEEEKRKKEEAEKKRKEEEAKRKAEEEAKRTAYQNARNKATSAYNRWRNASGQEKENLFYSTINELNNAISVAKANGYSTSDLQNMLNTVNSY